MFPERLNYLRVIVIILVKLDDLQRRYPRENSQVPSRQQLDAQENLLILFRKSVIRECEPPLHFRCPGKLREGISSSQRNDSFALDGMSDGFNRKPKTNFLT